jgi:hypothetical protein
MRHSANEKTCSLISQAPSQANGRRKKIILSVALISRKSIPKVSQVLPQSHEGFAFGLALEHSNLPYAFPHTCAIILKNLTLHASISKENYFVLEK